MNKLIELKGVTFGYDARPILEAVDLTIHERDCLLILGPNGGGKTTLLKLVMGIVQPWRGTVLYHESVRDRLGYVPQFSGFNTNFPITVLEMVSTGCISGANYLKPSKKENMARAEEAIRRMDLFGERDKNITDLSGGQLQRMLIARALVSDPAVLLLDEPTTSIDLASRINLLDFIRCTVTSRASTAIFSTTTGENSASSRWNGFTAARWNCWDMGFRTYFCTTTDRLSQLPYGVIFWIFLPTISCRMPSWRGFLPASSAA